MNNGAPNAAKRKDVLRAAYVNAIPPEHHSGLIAVDQVIGWEDGFRDGYAVASADRDAAVARANLRVELAEAILCWYARAGNCDSKVDEGYKARQYLDWLAVDWRSGPPWLLLPSVYREPFEAYLESRMREEAPRP